MSQQKTRVPLGTRLLVIGILLGTGYLLGNASSDATVQADVRRDQSEQQHFQSGAQRSEVILREISATLAKIDQRLDRMEKLATQFVNGQAQPRESRQP